MYYKNSIAAIRGWVADQYPQFIACEQRILQAGATASYPHLLWMCEQIEGMDTSSPKMAAKAGRWIGWMFAHLEMHNTTKHPWNNQTSRDMARLDASEGSDVPH